MKEPTEFIYADIVPEQLRFQVQITNYKQFVISKQVRINTYDPCGNREWKLATSADDHQLPGAVFISKDEQEVKALCVLAKKLGAFIRAQALK